MTEHTNIAWTESTWNPWQGCTKVSPGCAHCYMYRDKAKYGQDPTVVVRSKDPTFYKPLGWKDGRMVFTCSWSDWFHEDADEWRDEAWDIIRRTPQHTYQILTKRPERILEHLPADWGDGYPNVWLGTSVENQHFANLRIPQLLEVPAVTRFLSCEPLLGPLNLEEWIGEMDCAACRVRFAGGPCPLCGCEDGDGEGIIGFAENAVYAYPNIHWVIVGGESGPEHRPMDTAWAKDIRNQCRAAGVAFFFKQSAGLRSEMNPYIDGVQYREFPAARSTQSANT